MAESILGRYGIAPAEAPQAPMPERAASQAPRTGSILEQYGVPSEVAPSTPAAEVSAAPRRPRRYEEPESKRAPPAPTPGVPPAPRKPPPSTAEDIAKSAGSGLAMGLLADLPGLPGSIGQLVDIGSLKAREAYARAKEGFGFAEKGSAEKAIALAKQEAMKGKSPQEIAGDVNTILGITLPTSQGMEKLVRSVAPDLSYAPETRAGKLVGAGFRAVPSGIGTGGAGLLTRLGIAGTSGVLAEGAGQLTEGTEYETPARILGSLLGPAGFKTAKGLIQVMTGPGKGEIEKELLTAIARDVANGTSKMNSDQLKKAIESGASPSLFNMAGTETRKLISKYGFATPESRQLLEDLNSKVADQAARANTAMRQHIGSTLGVTDDAFDIQQAIRSSNESEINRLYKALETDPAARDVFSVELSSLTKSGALKDYMANARSLAKNPKSRIIAPTKTTSGNIFFWDQVKRDLDDAINKAYRQGESNKAIDLKNLRKQVVDELDTTVPNYQRARDAASESLGAQNAVDAGYNALRGASTAFKAGPLITSFKKYSPERKEMFRQGLAAQLAEIAEKSGPDDILRLIKDPNKSKVLQTALGQDELNSILGRAASESVLKRTRAYGAHLDDPSVQDQFIKGQIQFEMGPAMLAAVRGDFGPMVNILATQAQQAVTAGAQARNYRKTANEMMSLIGTDDPEKLKRLGEIIRKVPAAPGILGSTMDLMRNSLVRGTIGMPPSQEVTAPGAKPTTEGSVGMPTESEFPALEQEFPPTENIFDKLLQVESGKRQFDRQGNVVTSPVGAIGIAQIMPGTAPEAAKLAGLPYDPQRLKNDPAYNEALGRAYFEEQLRTFGNPVLAAAAYNAGPGAVRRALNATKESGEHFANFLPEETQNYIRKIFGRTRSQTGGRIARATGGKIGGSVEGLLNKLMIATEDAKKRSNSKTEDLLEVHDDHIAKALEVADKAI